MSKEELIMLKTESIIPHPDNPRKDLGDLEELTESIKKNGIMQNLTVIPTETLGIYMVLIGHRRLAAAKAAGLTEVPAKIVYGLSKKEEVGIMLEENMQRSDLTIVEQAYGFQMMLDLGETEETIAQKTGFSRTTVHHRLQIARLNRKVLQKQAEDNEFQLTITDLMELEKVERIEDRNHMLRTARDSRDLRFKIKLHLEKEKRKKNKAIIIKKLEEMGIREMSQGQYAQRYSSKWEQACSISLEEDPPEDLKIKGMTDPSKTFYSPGSEYDAWITIWKRASKEKETEKTEWEKRREEQERKRKEIIKLQGRLREERKIFIKGIINGDYGKAADEKKALEDLIEVGIRFSLRMQEYDIDEWICRKRYYNLTQEEKEELDKEIGKLTPLHKMLILTDISTHYRDIISWDSKWYEDVAKSMNTFHRILGEQWGYRINDEEIQMMLEGTHRNYVQE